jgi:hypothetical protein
MIHAILQDYLIENTTIIDPVSQVTIPSITTDKSLNDINPADISLKSGVSVIEADKKFTHNLTTAAMAVKDVRFTQSLDQLEYEFFDKRITLNNESHLPVHGWILSSCSIQDAHADTLFDRKDNVSVSLFLSNVMTTTGDQEVSGRITFANRSDASGDITSKYGLFRNAIRRGSENPGKIFFEDDLVVDAVTITGNVNDVDLSLFSEDTLRKKGKDMPQVISSQESRFKAGIDAKQDVNSWNIYGGSGHQMLVREKFNVLLRSGDQSIREHVTLEGPATMKNVTFEDQVSFQIPNIPEIPDNLTDCAKTINFGNTTLLAVMGSHVTFANGLNFSKFFGFDWSFLVDDMVMHKGETQVKVKGKKKFLKKVDVQGSLHLGDVPTMDGQLAGRSIADWDDVQTDEFQGLLSFMDDVQIDTAQFNSRINDAQLGPVAEQLQALRDQQVGHQRDKRKEKRNEGTFRTQNLAIDSTLKITGSLNGLPVAESFIPLSSKQLTMKGNVSFGQTSGVWTWAVDGNLTTACSLECQVRSDAWKFIDDRLEDIDHFIETPVETKYNLMPCHANAAFENVEKCSSEQ